MTLTEMKLQEERKNVTKVKAEVVYSIEVERVNPGNKNYTKTITGTLSELAREMFITPVPKKVEVLIEKGNAKKRSHGYVIYSLIPKI